jgi:hypothetical protein
MKSRLLQLLLSVVLVLGGYLWGNHSVTPVHAQSDHAIPKAYGKFVGTMGGAFVFEDSAGTLRTVAPGFEQSPEVYPRN